MPFRICHSPNVFFNSSSFSYTLNSGFLVGYVDLNITWWVRLLQQGFVDGQLEHFHQLNSDSAPTSISV